MYRQNIACVVAALCQVQVLFSLEVPPRKLNYFLQLAPTCGSTWRAQASARKHSSL